MRSTFQSAQGSDPWRQDVLFDLQKEVRPPVEPYFRQCTGDTQSHHKLCLDSAFTLTSQRNE